MKKYKLLIIISMFFILYKAVSAIVAVNLESDNNSGTVPFQVNFLADAVSPNTITNYEWDMDGNGSYETSGAFMSTAVKSYNAAGIYYTNVIAWDSAGDSAVATKTIYALDSNINVLTGLINGYVGLTPGTHIVTSDIIVDSGAVLVIKPDTILRFDENKYLRVKGNGTLAAIGDSTHIVEFASFSGKNWGGIIFDSFSLGRLEYSIIEKANRAIRAESYSTLLVYKNEIRNNGITSENGGGILLSDSCYVMLYASNIYNNTANYGGAFYNDNGKILIESCSVFNNTANIGSGFYSNAGGYNAITANYCNFSYDTVIANNFFVNRSINNQDASYNWWNTVDTAIIENSIYDFNDSTIYGTVDYSAYNEAVYNNKNIAPVVEITSNYESGNMPLTVTLTANAYDFDGSIDGYEWDLEGDGTFDAPVYESTKQYTYIFPDTYYPNVRVTDNDSAKATSTKTITVSSFITGYNNEAPTFAGTELFGLLNNGEESYVTVTINDDFVITKGEFFVKKNGESDNAFVSIYKFAGLAIKTFTKTIMIPREYITPRGLSYKITASDWENENESEVTGFLRVKVKDYIVPFPTWTWKMISFPLILNENEITSALGPMENRRAYKWDPVGKEYSKAYDTTFDPGDAFWFKIKEDNIPDPFPVIVKGTSVDPDNVPEISIPPGWSQIADPYAYKIASSEIKVKIKQDQDTVEVYVSNTTNVWLENQFLTYDYDSTIGKNSYMDLENILPDIGFWVKNRSDKYITLLFPEHDADASGSMTVNSPSRKVKNDGWGIKLKVTSKNCIDNDNYLGFLPGAENKYDFNDLSEPPPVDNYVSLYFPHSNWGKDNGRYRTDYRACGSFGVLEITNYDFIIETNARDKAALSWDIINPPLNYTIILHDKKENKKIDISDINGYEIDWADGDLKREFGIIIEWDNIYLLNSIRISDFDLNHIIDGGDISIFGSVFGTMQGESNWNPKVDLNKDKIIDGSDLYILGNCFGKNY